MNEQELREFAANRLKKQAGFKSNLKGLLGLSVLLIVIWFMTTPGGYFWPIWPILGVGVSALFSGIDAYSKNSGIISESQIDAEVRKLRGEK